MSLKVASLSDGDRAALWTVVAFLEDRMMEAGTIDWALQVGADRLVERMAVRHLLNSGQGPELEEPWTTAWRLIEESWIRQPPEDQGHVLARHARISMRLKKGDRSGGAVEEITALVTPCLGVSRPGRDTGKSPHPRGSRVGPPHEWPTYRPENSGCCDDR